MKKAYAYLRVSSDEQVQNFSLDTQEEICRREAQRREFEIVKFYREEGRSAKNIKGRPELIQLLEDCRKNKDSISAVFVYRIDRMARDTSDYLACRKSLAESGVAILSCTEPTGSTPTEKLTEVMLSAIAELDNAVRGERAKNGHRKRFEAGYPLGGMPIGYKKGEGREWVPDPATFNKVKKAWEIMSLGSTSLREISNLMTSWGLRTSYGKKSNKIRPQTAQRIFRCKLYAGVQWSPTYQEERMVNVEPMISLDTFKRVQDYLDGRKTVDVIRRYSEAGDFPLRRIIKCSKCGSGFTACWSKGRLKRYGYYLCAKNPREHKYIPVAQVENELVKTLSETKPTHEALELFKLVVMRTYDQDIKSLKQKQEEQEEEVRALKDVRQRLIKKNLDGVYSDEMFKEQNAMIESRLIAATTAVHDHMIPRYQLEEAVNFAVALFSDPARAYQFAEPHQKKALLCSMYPSGLVWNYPGISNTEISPLYTAITASAPMSVSTCGADELTIEHFIAWINPLKEVFPDYHQPAFAYAR